MDAKRQRRDEYVEELKTIKGLLKDFEANAEEFIIEFLIEHSAQVPADEILKECPSLFDRCVLQQPTPIAPDVQVRVLHELCRWDKDERYPLFLESLILRKEVDVNCTDEKGRTALMYAAFYNNIGATKALCAHPSIDLNLQDKEYRTALYWSVLQRHVDVCRLLVGTDGIVVNPKEPYGNTPLHLAVIQNDLACLNALLTHPNCDPNAADRYGVTPLLSSMSHSYGIFERLLKDKRTRLNAKEDGHVSAMHIAARSSYSRLEMLMKRRTTLVNARNSFGETPLHIAVQHVACRQIEMLLADPRVDVNIKDNKGLSALATALSAPVSIRLEEGFIKKMIDDPRMNPLDRTKDGSTILHLAAKHRPDLVRYIIHSRRVEMDARDNDGRTALHIAAMKSCIPAIRILIRHVQSEIKDNSGKRARDYCSAAARLPEPVAYEQQVWPICVICLDAKRDTVIKACGHLVMCYECANSLKQDEDDHTKVCPICRKAFTTTLRIQA
jgi:ankyrin repeat protein